MTKSSQCTYSGMDKQCCARCKAQPPSVHVLTGTIQHGDESITVPYILCIPCYNYLQGKKKKPQETEQLDAKRKPGNKVIPLPTPDKDS